jgi:hypothetical protein
MPTPDSTTPTRSSASSNPRWAAIVALVGCLVTAASTAATPPQSRFASAEAAVDALVTAERADTLPALERILGSGGHRLLRSGDVIADQQARARFLAAYDQAHHIDRESPNKAVLVIGDEDWPLPIPIVEHQGSWRFDTAAAAEEILHRRIGRNELRIIEVCRAYWQAQHDYVARETAAGEPLAYAQRMRSHPGQHDGLYWPQSTNDLESPLGPLVAQAHKAGYEVSASPNHPRPFHGYYLRILTRQGEHAPGGKREYLVDGHMTGGFALIAYPEAYGQTGIMSFMISQDGIVYEKNLGSGTRRLAEQLNAYDPDHSWHALH